MNLEEAEERGKELVEKIKQGKIRCRKSLVKAIMATPNTPEEDEIIIDVLNDYFKGGGNYWGKRKEEA